MTSMISVPITKAGIKVEVDIDQIPDGMLEMVYREGLKPLLNARMSKITVKDLEGDDLKAAKEAATKIANENLEKLYAGKYVKRGAAGTTDSDGKKIPGVVMTEALRLARAKVKDAIREAGMRVSHVAASDITVAAKELIAQDSSFVEQAKVNLEARTAKPLAVDIASLISVSPKLVAKAEERKAANKANKGTLSAKQAGKVAPKKGSKPAEVHA
jgi:hypothetical protein